MININDLPLNIQSKIKVLGNHWIWIGDLSGTGGPIVYFNGNNKATTRVIRHLLMGFDMNSELQLNHKLECQIKLCCNPDCMYEGTQKQNIADSIKLGNNKELRKTHCPQGHEYHVSPTNGHRYCQICKNKRRDKWRKIRKEENDD